MSDIIIILLSITIGALGFGLGYYVRFLHALGKRNSADVIAKQMLADAKEEAEDIVMKAHERALSLEEAQKKELKEREERLQKNEGHLTKKEETLDAREIALESEKEDVHTRIEKVSELKARIDETLAQTAELTKEEARAQLLQQTEKEHEENLMVRLQKLEVLGQEKIDAKAQDILMSAIYRLGNAVRPEIMTATVEIPNEEMKGKIIGKEGRNVRAFERETGVDVLIDESPGHIVLSSFDPVRREVARVALTELVKDGRIQPAKIEECVEKAKKEIAETMKKMGEKAAFECGIHNLHPDVIQILGRLHFRTSYGQNVLWHSVEMAHIASIIAAEVGADVSVARAGALLHDIGKAVSHEVQGTHVEIGRRILQKYGVDEAIITAMQAHHEEYPYETPESIIVQVADAISGGRPGARRDSIENYIKRLEDLEAIATNMDGVEKAFAIQAGREVRVLVNPDTMSDHQMHTLAKDIAKKIEQELAYPGEIKVNIIRENRAVSYAR